jgi:hypothetical protein
VGVAITFIPQTFSQIELETSVFCGSVGMSSQIISKSNVVAQWPSAFNDHVKVMLRNIARRVEGFAAGDPQIATVAVAKLLQSPNGFRNVGPQTYDHIEVDNRFANQALHRRASHMFDGDRRVI